MSGCDRGQLQSVDEALATILRQTPEIHGIEEMPLAQSLGRVLARDVRSEVDVPPADNSAVDGYVLPRGLQEGEGGLLPVVQRIAAGDSPEPLPEGAAARIFTGASIPPGGAAVLMQEDCQVIGEQLTYPSGWKAGQNIRPRGQDVLSGDVLLSAGNRVRATELGLLASVGCASIGVQVRPRVAVLCTGDELVEPGKRLQPGQIYNSNRYLLEALIRHTGCEPVVMPRVSDTREATRDSMLAAADQADILITTGGVSVGEEDHVKGVIQELGELSLWRLALKPGKPFAFGRVGDKPVIGLPGNPTSVLVTFGLLARPFLLKTQGRHTKDLSYWLPFEGSISHPGKRREFLRVRLRHLTDGLRMYPHPNQSSGMLSSACWADGLAIVPENTTVESGNVLEFIPFQNWLEN